jgi:hypothetical protein
VRRFTYRLTWPEIVKLYRLTVDAPISIKEIQQVFLMGR